MKTSRETPDSVIEKILELAVLCEGQNILEPSAGEGKILDYIGNRNLIPNLKFTSIELNKEKYDILVKKGYNAIHANFLEYKTDKTYDRIIACPPFKGNIDIVHIKRMFNMLEPYGKLVSLTSPYWVTNNEMEQIEFRKWLSDKHHTLTILPDNSFIENNKSVFTAILKICK